jgi:hypothetical protein
MIVALLLLYLAKPSFAFGIHKTCPNPWSDSRQHEIRRCFRASEIKFKCDYEPKDKQNPFGELELKAKFADGLTYVYGYGKMIGLDICLPHERFIRQILHKQEQACITTADGEYRLSDGTVYGRWSSVETAKGCVTR